MFTIMMFAFTALMAFAATSDLLSMTISNKIPLAIAGLFFPAAILAGFSPVDTGLYVIVGFAVLVVTFGCFAMGWMGGGDAKLMAATALWFGPTADLLSYLVTASLIGGVLTMALVAARTQMSPVTGLEFLDRLLEPKGGIPYGIALGIAGVIVFSDSSWMALAF